jgi:hypothetical protein
MNFKWVMRHWTLFPDEAPSMPVVAYIAQAFAQASSVANVVGQYCLLRLQ